MKEEKLLECSNYTLYKRLVPIRLKAFFPFSLFLSRNIKPKVIGNQHTTSAQKH